MRSHDERSWFWLATTPWFVTSVALLAVNDRVLKARFPGLLTGKLSDVAGVAMMAMLVTMVTRRPRLGCSAVAIAFGLLKTVPAVADRAVPVLGGRTLTDVNDLVALLVLVPLARWMMRERERRTPQGALAEARLVRDDQPLRSTVRAATVGAQVALIAGATLATSATSCIGLGVDRVRVDEDRFVAVTHDEVFVSDDGRDWTLVTRNSVPPADTAVSIDRSCVGAVCFEITDFTIVRVEGEARTVEFALSDGEVESLQEGFVGSCGSAGTLLGSIAAFESSEGIVAVASMSEYGVLARTPDGAWEFERVGEWAIGADGRPIAGNERAELLISIGAIGSLVMLVLVSVAVGFRARRVGRSVPGHVIGTLAGLVAAAALYFLLWLFDLLTTSPDPVLVLWIPGIVSVVSFGAMMFWLAGRPRADAANFDVPPYPAATPGGGPLPPQTP